LIDFVPPVQPLWFWLDDFFYFHQLLVNSAGDYESMFPCSSILTYYWLSTMWLIPPARLSYNVHSRLVTMQFAFKSFSLQWNEICFITCTQLCMK
jgi:hypothetical protein